MSEKIKLLFLSATAEGKEPLQTDVELREVDEKIRAGLNPEQFEIAVVRAVRRDRLQDALLRHRPHIVHFSGHGERRRGIILEDEKGRRASVSGASLAEIFAILRGCVRVVFLNACSTKQTARAFQHFVEYTVAMNRPISDASAIAFASAFYNAIALSEAVPGAFWLGVNQLRMLKLPGATIPELFVGAGVPVTREAPPQLESAAMAGRRPLIDIRHSTVIGSVITVNDAGNLVVGR